MNNYTWEIEYHDLPAVPMPRRTLLHKTQSATRKYYEQDPHWVIENDTVKYIPSNIQGTGTARTRNEMRKHLEYEKCFGIYRIPKAITIVDPDGIHWTKEYPFPKVFERTKDPRLKGLTNIKDIVLDETWLKQDSPLLYEEPDIDLKVWGKGIFYLVLGLLVVSFLLT